MAPCRLNTSHVLAQVLRLRLLAALLGSLSLLCLGAVAQASTGAATRASVGEATLVIGQARITGADGVARAAERGASLRAGDVVETQAGAHVHLRFVDGGRVSVRPLSRLVIEQYSQPGLASEQGAIKFRLEDGVVRSITGAWGEAARDRFRLNTPVAAIGVKGTDFVVRSSGETTAASVFTGAIVVAPLSGACAVALGPCSNGSEKLLSADMKGQMLELQRDQPTPRLVPAVDLLAMARVGAGGLTSASDARVESARAERPMSGNAGQGDTRSDSRSDGSASKLVVTDRLAAEALASAMRNAPEQDLYWARYPWAAQLSGDDFTKRFDVALVQGTRGLATDGAFSLRRPELATFAPQGASATFRLSSGAASVVRDAGRELEPVSITEGSLSVDFVRSTFATSLTTAGPKLGTATIQANGGVDALGSMRSSSGNAMVTGGLNADGHKAGLLFRRDVPGGVLQGVTLWGR